jgi:hypothetical protein
MRVKSEPEEDNQFQDSKAWKRGPQSSEGEPPPKRRTQGDMGMISGDGMAYGHGHGMMTHGQQQQQQQLAGPGGGGNDNSNPWQDLAAQVSGPPLGSADIQMAIDSLPGPSQWQTPTGGSGQAADMVGFHCYYL